MLHPWYTLDAPQCSFIDLLPVEKTGLSAEQRFSTRLRPMSSNIESDIVKASDILRNDNNRKSADSVLTNKIRPF
jgi:hypothetical protein